MNKGLTMMLTDRDAARIEDAACRLLEEVGIAMTHSKGIERLHGLGCRIEQGRVMMPRGAVERAIATLRLDSVFRDRSGRVERCLGQDGPLFHNATSLPFVLDAQTGVRRLATLKDLADLTRLLDALPHADVVMPLVDPQDVPRSVAAIVGMAEMLRNTTKPMGAAPLTTAAEVRYAAAMATACAGKRSPPVSVFISPISPLRFPDGTVETILAAAEADVQVQALPCPLLGGTAPVTLAGALAQQHAENLATLFIAAAARPGTRVLASSRIIPMNMRSATAHWGGGLIGVAGACAAQLLHRMGMACDSYGFSTADPRPGTLAAREKTACGLVAALGGVDFLSGIGMVDNALTASAEMAVMDSDTAALIKRVAKGCEANDRTIPWEVMKETILSGDTFMAQPHTVEMMWTDCWNAEAATAPLLPPGVLARGLPEGAEERSRWIMAHHVVEPLPPSVEEELRDIANEANRELNADG